MRLIKELLLRFNDLKIRDFYAVIQFLIAYPISKIYKYYRKNLWLICEESCEARDNGYILFKYIRTHHKEQDVVYAIKKKSFDYGRVSLLGKTVEYGSLVHWILYLSATRNISSQKGGKPNAAVCYILEVFLNFKSNRVFLQHGITKDDAKWLYYKNTKFDLFICAAKPEYDYIKSRYGYPANKLKYTGFCRYDELHDIDIKTKQVLIMPTWRNWLAMPSKRKQFILHEDASKEDLFLKSDFYIQWKKLLNSPALKNIALQYNLDIVFYPHRNMQKYLKWFKDNDNDILVADWKEYGIQKLIKESGILITDYSSVFFDFIYMKKPVIFYQFDVNQYRKYQYKEGYFDYKNNQFGDSNCSIEGVINSLSIVLENGLEPSYDYLLGHKSYFKLFDKKNSERVYREIKNMIV